jgi:hypothetical protein
MTYEATQQTALDLIAVHGAEAVAVARECVRALLRAAEADAVATWLAILAALRSRLG